MPILPWEDRSIFFDEFSFEAVPEKGQPFKCWLSNGQERAQIGDYVQVTSTGPYIEGMIEHVGQLHKRDKVTVAGVDYWLVDDPIDDGTGITRAYVSRSNEDNGQWYK